MDSFKTGRGACTVSEDTLHMKSGWSIILYRLIEFNRKWLAVFLASLSLFGVSYYYGGPRTLDRFLGFLEFFGWVVLISIALGILLSVFLYGSELKEWIANLRDPDSRTSFLTGRLDIPFDSITSVEKVQTGNPSVTTTNWLVLHLDDGGTEGPVAIWFPPEMSGERDKAIDIFEARGISVHGGT